MEVLPPELDASEAWGLGLPLGGGGFVIRGSRRTFTVFAELLGADGGRGAKPPLIELDRDSLDSLVAKSMGLLAVAPLTLLLPSRFGPLWLKTILLAVRTGGTLLCPNKGR